MIERDVKNKVKRLIATYEKRGYVFWTYWPVQTGFGKHGIPDCLLCFKGRLVAIECKVDRKEPSTRQWLQIREIDDADGYVLVIDQHNFDELESLFEYLAEDKFAEAYLLAACNLRTYPKA